MIVFQLTMPHRGSWNNKWSGEDSSHIIVRRDTPELLKLAGKSFMYRWNDGWTACIDVRHMKSTDAEYKKLVKQNTGFCGYKWMVDSIIDHGDIYTERELKEMA